MTMNTDEIRATIEEVLGEHVKNNEISNEFELEEIQDNIWDMYISPISKNKKEYNKIFEDILAELNISREEIKDRRAIKTLSQYLKDNVKGYSGIKPGSYRPKPEDMEKIKSYRLKASDEYIALASMLAGLREMFIINPHDGSNVSKICGGILKNEFNHLEKLGIEVPVTMEVIKTMTQNKSIRELEDLSIGTWYNSIKLSDKMMATILTEFSSLKRISFINTGTSSSGAASLGAHIGGLEILDLPGNNIDHKGIKALLTGVSKSLQYLGLAKNNLDTAAAQCLADSENLFNLRGLYISSNTIKDRGFSALVHGRFRYLEVLSVGSNELTDKLLLHENECLFSKSLRELSISENSMGPNALEQILECFPNLKKIDISENPVGDRGIQIIADSPAAGNIKSLKLSRCNLGPEGMEFLFKSSSFKKLQSLELVGNPLIDDGTALFMAKSKLIRKLSSLYIFNCGYGAKGEKALRRWKKN